MTVLADTEKLMAETEREEKSVLPKTYGCEILFEKTTLQEIKDPSLPNDAYVITYRVNNETFMDLCRGSRVRDRKSTRLNSSHVSESRMPSSA